MGRIRSLKPETPQSESFGRLSIGARLLFVQLWTICDDSGLCRAAPKILASLLYPWDDHSRLVCESSRAFDEHSSRTNRGLIEEWLSELSIQGMIDLYRADDALYLQVTNWLKHQKIDRPTPSKLPKFDESSRVIVEPSTSPRHGIGRDSTGEEKEGIPSSPPSSENSAFSENPFQPLKNPKPQSTTEGDTREGAREASAPVDAIFGEGLAFLVGRGVQERQARSFLGMLRKKHGDDAVLSALIQAEGEDITDPLAWLPPACAVRATSKVRPMPINRQESLEARNRAIAMRGAEHASD